MSVAHSYIIHQTLPLIENLEIIKNNEENKINDIIDLGINLLIGVLSIKQIGTVSAEENSNISFNCCIRTNEGGICQDVASTIPNNAPKSCANPIETSCDYVLECKKGCCFDSEQGICTPESTKEKCEDDGGGWNDDENCDILECQKGCCVLGGQTEFVTERRCEVFSSLYGFEKDFRGEIKTELECWALSLSEVEGACILKGKCSIKTGEECISHGGDFFGGVFCSAVPGVNCSAKNHIGCAEEGKLYDVYYFDSCGNREDIAEECNYPESKCVDGACKDLGCKNAPANVGKQDRFNGEKWCLYDGYIGDGKDTIGSEHWIAYCNEGEVEIDICGDSRGYICTQAEIEEDGKTFSTASCVVNEAFECMYYNSELETMEENCKENTDCMIKNINVDKYFKFDMCVPRYPRGFDLLGEDSFRVEMGRDFCSLASQKCTVQYQKDWKGDWDCKQNCDCETAEFTNQMNDLCVSLGDCGSYVNYVGDGADYIKVSRAPGISWTKYKKYAEPVEGQYAEPKSIREILGAILGDGYIFDPDNEEDINKALEKIGKISGALGIAALGPVVLSGQTAGMGLGIGKIVIKEGASPWVKGMGGFSNVAVGASVGMLVGGWLAEKYGIYGQAARVMALAGGVAGGAIGYAVFKGSMTGCWPVVIIAVCIMIYIWLVGWGKIKTRTVEFTCLPWQAPPGGENCYKCNEDPLRPCTKYQCSSLGQACQLLNEDTDYPVCEKIKYEPNPPVISPKEVLSEGHEFFNQATKKVEIRKENGECIQEFTPVAFTLETDERAQCKYNFERTVNYEDMGENYPAEGTALTKTHSLGFIMPSLSSLQVYGVTGNLIERFGNLSMYVRCQDCHGNFNIEEYTINFCINSEPDITAAWISHFTPENNSYLKYGANETPLKIYLNEPAECKYDAVGGKNYDEMTNSMVCKTEFLDRELYGWPCTTQLTGLTKENKFYIKCKDKPWVITPEDIEKYGERNINENDFVYYLSVSENELEIDSITVSYENQEVTSGGTIVNGFEPISVELEVKTSGGIDNGISTCYWGSGLITPLFETYSNIHKQLLTGRMRGGYKIQIKCQDDAENTVLGDIEFTIDVDSEPPVIIDNSTEGNNLILTTDEDAECYYNLDTCNFNFENGTSITTMYSTTHTIYGLNPRLNYHVKCEDMWGNKNPGCAIVIGQTEKDDGAPPIVVRMFNDYGNLKIITNEKAKCYYDFYECNFNLEDRVLMTEDYSTEHSVEWLGWTYHIKCIDDWGNMNSGCAIVVKPSSSN